MTAVVFIHHGTRSSIDDILCRIAMSPKVFPLFFSNLLIPIAILVFAKGFFPYKPFIPGKAAFVESDHVHQREAPLFDKVIFMVVDALRR